MKYVVCFFILLIMVFGCSKAEEPKEKDMSNLNATRYA